MARAWSEVSASPEFQSLTSSDKEAARQQYFADVVAPRVSTDDLDAAKSQFDSDTKPTAFSTARDVVSSGIASAFDAIPPSKRSGNRNDAISRGNQAAADAIAAQAREGTAPELERQAREAAALKSAQASSHGLAGDAANDLIAGTMQVPGAAASLADIGLGQAITGLTPVRDAANYWGEKTGFQPGKWADSIQKTTGLYSPETNSQKDNVAKAWNDSGVEDLSKKLFDFALGGKTTAADLKDSWSAADIAYVAKAYKDNPRASLGTIMQSAPSMLAGGAISRGLMGLAERAGVSLSAEVAGGVGEGLITAGQNTDQMLNNGADPRRAAVAGVISGAVTGAIGVGSGKVATKMGLPDINTMMAGKNVRTMPWYKSLPTSMVQEGLFEELPQSMQEQIWQNWAEKKPLGEGVLRSGVEGAIAGAAMAGGAHPLTKLSESAASPGQAGGDTAPVPSASGAPADTGAVNAADILGTPAVPTESDKALYTPKSLTALDRVNEIDAALPVAATEDAAALRQERDQITATWPKAIEGSSTSFSTETGARLGGQYALMDAGDLTTSHDENLRPVLTYPSELQPRERDRHASEMQVQGIVGKLDPARLGESGDVATGAPIVGADGLVESGNARVIALKRVYQANGQKAQDYRQFIKDNSGRFGLSPEQVDAMQKPVLVRVRTTPVNRAEFARQANASTVARMSPSEQAKADAAQIDSLDDLNPTESGDFMSGTSAPFIRRFMAKLAGTEQAGLIDSNGQLSQAGYTRIRNAVLAKAYGDSPVLLRMVESLDDNSRNVSKALLRVAPQVAKAREAISEGALHDADIVPDLLSAVQEFSDLKDKGTSVDEALAQAGMFGDKLSPEARQILVLLNENARSPRRIAEFVQNYLDALAAAGNPNQGSMFGDTEAPTKANLMAAAARRTSDAATTASRADAGNANPAEESRSKPGNAPGDQAGNGRNEASGGSAASQSEWVAFPPESGTIGIPRADMPQVRADHRGALIQFLGGLGITHTSVEEMPANKLKPTQGEFSTKKAAKWAGVADDSDRSILVSSDGYILDGHHQWVNALNTKDQAVKVIRFSAPIKELLAATFRFPSVEQSEGANVVELRAKARQDFKDALADLAQIATKHTRAAMLPEDTPGLMPTLIKLSSAAIAEVGYQVKDIITHVKKALHADSALKTFWNKVGNATYRKAAEQAAMQQATDHVDDLFSAAEARRGQQDLFAQPAPAAKPVAKSQATKPNEEAIVNRIDRKATPEEKVKQLVALSKENAPIIDEFARRVDEKFGTRSKSSFKTPENIIAKSVRPSILERKPWFGVEHVRDGFRFKTALNSYADLPAIIDMLRKDLGAEIVKADVAKVLAPLEWGWRIAAFDLRMPNGQLVEYYLPIKEQEAYKKAEGHKLFEDWRSRNDKKFTPEEKAEQERDLKRSNDGYGAAWAASIKRTGQDEAVIATALRAAEISAAASAAEARAYPSSANSPIVTSGAGALHLPARSLTAENLSALSNTNATDEPSVSTYARISSTSDDSIAKPDEKRYTKDKETSSGGENGQNGDTGSQGAQGKEPGAAPATGSPGQAEDVPGGPGRGNQRPDRNADDGTGGEAGGEPGQKLSGEGGNPEGVRGAGKGDRAGRNAGLPAGRDIPAKSGRNYAFGDGDLTYAGSWQVKARQNVEAVELLKKLQTEGRQATREEQAVLAKFIGWGSSEIANSIFGSKLDKQLEAISNYEDASKYIGLSPYGLRQRAQGFYQAFQVLSAHDPDKFRQSSSYLTDVITKEMLEKARPDMGAKKWAELRDRLKAAMTADEWDAASRSTQYAHYTSKPVVKSLLAAISKMGFKGGTILEPGAGIGVFPGLMSSDMGINSIYTGIEFDPITGGILKQLFPDERILVESFIDSKLPENFYDVAFGNPPFSGEVTVLADPKYVKNAFKLHDYFFAKSIDSVKPGGLVVFVTSRYTMDKKTDKARAFMAERADLVGAIRLPQTAFQKNAGTDVVTDVLFLRKKVTGATFEQAQPWMGLGEVTTPEGKFLINEYFAAHPEMVLGEHSGQGKMQNTPAPQYTLLAKPGDIEAQFAAAVENLPADVFVAGRGSAAEAAKVRDMDFNPKALKEGSFYISDAGVLMQREGGVGVRAAEKYQKDAEVLKDYISLRDAVKQTQLDQLNDGDWESSLKALQKAYANFTAKHGRLLQNTSYMQRVKVDELDEDGIPTGKKIDDEEQRFRFPMRSKIQADTEYTLALALEDLNEETGEVKDSKWLTERTLNKPTVAEVKTPADALLATLDESGVIDMKAVAERIGLSEQETIDSLGTLVYEDPAQGWVMADEYLSGNVKKKLAQAEEAAKSDKAYQRNVEALKDAQPAPRSPEQITPQIGMNWIPAEVYEDFLKDVTGVKAKIEYIKRTRDWVLTTISGEGTARATADWGVGDKAHAGWLMEKALTGAAISLNKSVSDGKGGTKQVFDPDRTEAANQKRADLRKKFQEWLFQDAKRTTELVQLYNDKFNTNVQRKFDGRHLTLPGASRLYDIFDHVKRGAWRVIQTGNTYLAHAVGSGKAQPLDAKVLTPTGWKVMGDIAPGDFVISVDGSPTMVEAVFPQGEKEIFRVEFNDGSATECCEEHLWLTQTYKERSAHQRALRLGKHWPHGLPKVRSLAEIRETLVADHLGAKNHSIPMVAPVQFSARPLEIDAYVMGALLGDGGMTGSSIILSCADDEILSQVSAHLPDECELVHRSNYDYALVWRGERKWAVGGGWIASHPVQNALRAMGLMGKPSHEKFIPDQYLFNTTEARVALLQGLMDTDGTVEGGGSSTRFSTTSRRLADGMTSLVRSLGGLVREREKSPTYTHNGERRFGRIAFELCVSLPSGINPFRLTRKASKVIPKSKYSPARYITAIASVGRKLAQCIRVAHPSHLYVTDDFVVTHNTFEMVISAMEQKRLGKIKKPMIIVPGHMLQQFASEWQQLYPTARLMVADEENFHTENRRRFVSRVAMSDLDGVIMTHSSFGLLDLDPEFKKKTIDQELEILRASYVEAGGDLDDIGEKGRKDPKIKRIEAQIEKLEQQLAKAASSAGKDKNVRFDEMGVDMLYVDEAHLFRKLSFATARQTKGIDPNGSQMAWDLYMKTRWLAEKNPTRNLVMASGTAITNTTAELYTVQRFMAPQVLEENGLAGFDDWAAQFGVESTQIESTASGKYEPVTRFQEFVNVGEMTQMLRDFADVLNEDHLAALLGDKRPKVVGGSRKMVITPKTETYATFLREDLAPRIEASRKWKPSFDQPYNPDPIIAINIDARLAAIDMRFMEPTLPNDPDSKLNQMIDGVIRVYKENAGNEYRGKSPGKDAEGKAIPGPLEPIKGATQMVFFESGFGKMVAERRGFNARAWMEKRLRDAGIPSSQLAFMDDYKKSSAKLKLFGDVNKGKVRVLVGSSAAMGTGVNAQQRLIALHHLDSPYVPAILEQREGRIVRQGNKNTDVQIYAYSTFGSFDENLWQMLARKKFFIEQAMSGDPNIRKIEDVGEVNQLQMAAGLVAENPFVMQHAGAKADVDKMTRLYRNHEDQRARHRDDYENAGRTIALNEKWLPEQEKAAERVKDLHGDLFTGKADGKTYATRKEWGAAILSKFKELADTLTEKPVKIGELSGFDVEFSGQRNGTEYRTVARLMTPLPVPIAFDANMDPVGMAVRAVNALVETARKPIETSRIISEAKAKRASLESRLDAPFPLAEQLANKIKEMADLEQQMLNYGTAPAPSLTFNPDELANATTMFSRNGKWYHSALASTIPGMAKVADKAGMIAPAQAKAWLLARQKEGKFKGEELNWSGVLDWIDMQAGKPVFERGFGVIEEYRNEDGTWEQVDDFGYYYRTKAEAEKRMGEIIPYPVELGIESRRAVKEFPRVDLGARGGKIAVADIEQFVSSNGVQVEEVTLGDPVEMDANDARRFGATSTAAAAPTKFAQWQLPGGENYRELLLTLPAKRYWNDGSPVTEEDLSTQFGRENADRAAHYGDGVFQSSHFPDQSNILAHVRFNERVDADGNRVLFIEELQSDWAQKGRKEGFGEIKVEPNTGEHADSRPWRVGDVLYASKANAEESARSLSSGRPPLAPFVGKTEAWTALALKRMIAYAAENGFDRVAWTTGEQQAARYDLSKQIDSLHYDPYNKQLSARKGNQQVLKEQGVEPDKIADYVGKEAAKKLLETELNGAGNHELKGVDLKVGGEGMKGFYDKIVPGVANDVLKKLGGGKVGEIELPPIAKSKGTGWESTDYQGVDLPASKQPGFDITDSMRRQVEDNGIALFSRDTPMLGSMKAKDVRAIVEPFRQAAQNLPAVHVLQGTSDAPRAVQKVLREHGAMHDAAGLFFDGEIYLFASHLNDTEHAQRTFLHEAQHYGLHGLFGNALDATMMHLYENNGTLKVKANARQKAESGLSLVGAIEETLADMAGSGAAKKLNGWDRVVAAVRGWLRRAGWVGAVTDNDVLYLIHRAQLYWQRAQAPGYANVKRGRLSRGAKIPAVTADPAPRQSVSPNGPAGATSAVEDGLWRDENGRPVVVYHGTTDKFPGFNSSPRAKRNTTGGDKVADSLTWFTDNKFIATKFANGSIASSGNLLYPGAQIVSAHLRMSNPRIVDMARVPLSKDEQAYLRRVGRDVSDTNKQEITEIGFRKEREVKAAIANGNDGIIFKNGFDGPSYAGDVFAVFDPEQIIALNDPSAPVTVGASRPAFSRSTTASAPAVRNSQTANERADAIINSKVAVFAPIDKTLQVVSNITGATKLASWTGGKIGQLLDRLTPETVKGGMVSDYGIPEAVLDQRAVVEGRQRRQVRAAGALLDKLSTLTRAESRVAYEWMNSADPQSSDYFMDQLPPESIKTLAEVEKMIDRLSKEAVALGQLDPEAFKRNRFAYLHRSYVKHTAELTGSEAKGRARAISVLGDQYKGRGMSDATDMARIKNIAPEWWKRKLQAGKADKGLKGEKFIRLELREVARDTIKSRNVKSGPNKGLHVSSKPGSAMVDSATGTLPGINPELAKGKLKEVAYWPAGEPIPAKLSTWDQAGTWEVRDTKGPNLILWRDFTKQERVALGEIDDARYAIAKTLHGMIHDVETGRYLQWLAQNYAKKEGEAIDGTVVTPEEGRWMLAQAFKPGEWVKVPESVIPGTKVKKYGTLAGRYLPGPIWNDVRQIGGRPQPLGETYSAILRMWKTSKTALSPAVHMNNVMANMVMADWHDVSAGHVLKALRIMTSKDAVAKQVMARYTDSGGSIGTWAAKELEQEQLRPLLDALEKELGLAGQTSGQIGVMAAVQAALGRRFPEALDALKRGTTGKMAVAAGQAMIDMYEAEDQVFRLAAFLRAKEAGASDAQAGKEARKSFLDYRINAPWVQMMRSTAFPFIAFTYRAVPMLLETAAKKPWKLMKLGLFFGALNMLGYMGSGGDEDKERKLLPEEKAGRTWGLTPKLVRMPWNDANDSPVFLDVRRWIPVGDVFDMGQTHSAIPILPAMTIGGPLSLMAEFASNKVGFTGKPITLETDTPLEHAEKTADWLYKAFAPNIVVLPGTYAFTSAWDAGKGKTDTFGREQSLPQSLLSSVGIKVGSYPAEVLQRNAILGFKAKESEIDKNIFGLNREYWQKGITADQWRDKVDAQIDKKRKLVEDFQRRTGG